MSNSLLLFPADVLDPGRDPYLITVIPNTGEGTTLIGTGGCLFVSKAESLSAYENAKEQVHIFGNANEFVAVFGAHTKNNTAYGKVTLDRPLKVDLEISNIDERVTVIPAGQTSGTFTVELPIGGADLSPREARDRVKANAIKAMAKR